MNIAVVQPQGHGSGTTAVASLLACEIAARRKKVCLTNASNKSDTLCSIFGKDEKAEIGDALELINLLKYGGIQKDKIGNYSKQITESLDLFVVNREYEEGRLSEKDVSDVLLFLGNSGAYDYVIYDVDRKNLLEPVAREVVNAADIVILVLTQDKGELNRLKEELPRFDKLVSNNKKTIVVLNKYSSILGDIKAIAGELGKKNVKNWVVLHRNDHITLCNNKGQTVFLANQIREGHSSVVELRADINALVSNILAIRRKGREADVSKIMGDDTSSKKPFRFGLKQNA